MLWNEFIKLNHVSKLSLNEQMRKFNEHIMYEEQVAGSIRNIITVPVTITNPIGNGEGIITNLFINDILNQTQTDSGSKTVRVDVGSRFYVVINQTVGYDGIEYTLRNNGVTVNSNSQEGSGPLTSPTFTAAPGGNYVFTCIGFST
jgi:hypothetical protein